MTEYTFAPLAEEDVAELVRNLREADAEEMKALGGSYDQIAEGLAKVSHDTMVCRVDGKLACAFGVHRQTVLGTTGIMWLLGTPILFKNTRTFWRASQEYVAHARQNFEVLTGTVWSRNIPSIRWLRRLGFTVSETPYPVGPNKEIFYQFFWVKE